MLKITTASNLLVESTHSQMSVSKHNIWDGVPKGTEEVSYIGVLPLTVKLPGGQTVVIKDDRVEVCLTPDGHFPDPLICIPLEGTLSGILEYAGKWIERKLKDYSIFLSGKQAEL